MSSPGWDKGALLWYGCVGVWCGYLVCGAARGRLRVAMAPGGDDGVTRVGVCTCRRSGAKGESPGVRVYSHLVPSNAPGTQCYD